MTWDGPNGPDRPAIRPYHPDDLAAVYDIGLLQADDEAAYLGCRLAQK